MNMDEKRCFNYTEFLGFNENVNELDYLHAVWKCVPLPSDFLIKFAQFVWPEFMLVDGKIFLTSTYNDEVYRRALSNEAEVALAQFWTNLLEITGVFNDLELDKANYLAHIVADGWNRKIKAEFPALRDKARVISDAETEEVFVTIDSGDVN